MTCGTTAACTELLLQILVIGISNGAVIALNAVGVFSLRQSSTFISMVAHVPRNARNVSHRKKRVPCCRRQV